ncbi:putative ribonuclease H-like domain-containing protein [Tanacetum coccineum]
MVPRAVLMKYGLVSFNTARQVNTDHPKITVNSARSMSNHSKSAHSTVKWPINKNTAFKNNNFNQRVNTVKDKNINTVRPKVVVNAARPKVVVNAGNLEMDLQDQGVIDSRCSSHMTGNMSYLTNYEEIDEGYVAFGDDYSRFSWVFFLATKDETSGILKSFITRVENLIDQRVKVIRCDNGTDFKNKEMNQFCMRKVDSKLPTTFKAEAVNNACYVQNRVLVTKPHNKTPYELFLGRKPALGFMRPFGCLVTILNTIDYLGKFDGKANEGFFVGYSINSKAFREISLMVMQTVDSPFSQSSKSSPDAGFKPSSDDGKKVNEDPRKDTESINPEKDDNVNSTNNYNASSTNEVNVVGKKAIIELPDDPNMPALEDIVYSDNDEYVGAEADMNNLDAFMPVSPIPATRVHKDHPVEQIIGDLNSAPQTRRMTKNLEEHGLFTLVQQRTKHKDFQNCFFAYFLSQVEPKKGKIEEEVYVCQLPRFEDPDFPDKVYKFEKALYGLHQALNAWYEALLTYLLENRFQIGKIDNTLFIKRDKGLQVKQKKDGIFISQDKYVTEILKNFGFTDVKTASKPMETQKLLLKDKDGEEVDDVHLYRYLKGQPKLGLWYPKDSPFDLVAYTDSDYARASLDRKSTTGEAEYVAASSCCGQVLWIQNQLLGYGDCNEQKLIHMVKIHTDKNVADLLTKAFDLQALVDGKKIIVTKASVRRDLQLNDEEGTDCLPNATIFEEPTRIGYEKLSQKLTFYKTFFSPQ